MTIISETYPRWSFLGVLASEGIAMYRDAQGNLRARGHVTDPEVAAFIRTHREEILRELLTPR